MVSIHDAENLAKVILNSVPEDQKNRVRESVLRMLHQGSFTVHERVCQLTTYLYNGLAFGNWF